MIDQGIDYEILMNTMIKIRMHRFFKRYNAILDTRSYRLSARVKHMLLVIIVPAVLQEQRWLLPVLTV